MPIFIPVGGVNKSVVDLKVNVGGTQFEGQGRVLYFLVTSASF